QGAVGGDGEPGVVEPAGRGGLIGGDASPRRDPTAAVLELRQLLLGAQAGARRRPQEREPATAGQQQRGGQGGGAEQRVTTGRRSHGRGAVRRLSAAPCARAGGTTPVIRTRGCGRRT